MSERRRVVAPVTPADHYSHLPLTRPDARDALPPSENRSRIHRATRTGLRAPLVGNKSPTTLPIGAGMAELTNLESKLGEVTGLAMAAQAATDKVLALAEKEQ